MGSYIMFPAAGGGGGGAGCVCACACSPFMLWYIKVKFELGEFVVPVKDHPIAWEGSIEGDPGRFSMRGERLSMKRPAGDALKDSFLLQPGIMSCLIFVISYSCSV